ncbi:MAG: DUF1456 family protein [Coxiellaceae bacterium]|nr:DUF1456 family protein [Coxiellaceae bacterium]
MQNNDFFRRLRYALKLDDPTMLSLFEQASHAMSEEKLLQIFKDEEEPDYQVLSDAQLSDFLDAYIVKCRGKSDKPHAPFNPSNGRLTNNILLKKLRIALKYDEQAMLKTFSKGGVEISSSELGALFRKPGSRHYRACGDQWVRHFLAGLKGHKESKTG